jgi:hypothetical protein
MPDIQHTCKISWTTLSPTIRSNFSIQSFSDGFFAAQSVIRSICSTCQSASTDTSRWPDCRSKIASCCHSWPAGFSGPVRTFTGSLCGVTSLGVARTDGEAAAEKKARAPAKQRVQETDARERAAGCSSSRSANSRRNRARRIRQSGVRCYLSPLHELWTGQSLQRDAVTRSTGVPYHLNPDRVPWCHWCCRGVEFLTRGFLWCL